MSQLKEDSQRALDQAAVENKVLQGQLESLENFRLNKDKLEKELRSKEELIEQQKDHSEALYRLEKKAVLDKDRSVEHALTIVVLLVFNLTLVTSYTQFVRFCPTLTHTIIDYLIVCVSHAHTF